MNYYERHIGDYLKDTAHLSMLEDGAYNRLIDQYYSREQSLPASIKDCCKLARATSKAERAAVALVLEEFFVLTDNGHQQKRCDDEIERFLGKRAKAKASADARWNDMRLASERNANASPPNMRTHPERISEHDATHAHAPGRTRARAPARPQSPVTSNQEEKDPPAVRVPPTRKCPPAFEVTAQLREWAARETPGVNVDRETETLRDHTFRTAISDWAGAWRNWMRKARPQINGAVRHASVVDRRISTMNALTGKDRHHERREDSSAAETIDITARVVT